MPGVCPVCAGRGARLPRVAGARYPAHSVPAPTRYIKVAAMLPGKSVREVAWKAKQVASAVRLAGTAAAAAQV